MTRPVRGLNIQRVVDVSVPDPFAPVYLEWRPIGVFPTPTEFETQLQRERGYAFWQAQRRGPR
jgi:hypothetical protein